MSDYIELPNRPKVPDEAKEAWLILMDDGVSITTHTDQYHRDSHHLWIHGLTKGCIVEAGEMTIVLTIVLKGSGSGISCPQIFIDFLRDNVFGPLMNHDLLEEAIQLKML